MAEWISGLQEAIDYIEANLTDDLDIRDISARAFLSPYYFQRIFHALCGVSVAEYVRSRRMSLAGEALAAGARASSISRSSMAMIRRTALPVLSSAFTARLPLPCSAAALHFAPMRR